MNLLIGYFGFEMKLMEWLYEIGNTFLDVFFWLISQLGGSIAIILFMSITYWIINKNDGKKMAYAIISSMTFNNLLKSFIGARRPFEFEGHEHLKKLENSPLSSHATGSSFPSGHSQNSASAFMSLILYFKKKWITILSICFIILVPISRLYLGVHFPHDVFVGTLIGLLFAFLSFKLLQKTNKMGLIYIITCLIFTPFLFFKSTNYDFYRSYGLLIGAGLGILFEEKFINFETNNLTKKNIILRLLIGFSILLILYMGGKLIPVFEEINFLVVIHHFIVSFALFGLIPFIFKKTNI